MLVTKKRVCQIIFYFSVVLSLCSCKIFAKKEKIQPYNNYQPYYPQQAPQQQYYYPPQNYYYPPQNYYSPQPVPNSRYYNNYYDMLMQNRYSDYDSYYSLPANQNGLSERQHEVEKAVERSVGAADDKQ